MTYLLPPAGRPTPARLIVAPTNGAGINVPSHTTSSDDDGPEPLDWRRIRAAVKRWRWLVMGTVIVGTLAGVVASRIMKPVYRAQATIWIDSRDRHEAGPAPFQSGQLLDPEAWLDLMRSYAVLDEAARAEQLYLHAPTKTPPALFANFAVADTFRAGSYRLLGEAAGYRLETADGIQVDRAARGDSLGRSLGFRWVPAAGLVTTGSTATFEVTPLRDAATQLAEQLQLRIDPDGNLLHLDLEGTDRGQIVRVLDRVADRYVEVAGELKRQKLTELSKILSEQLAGATSDLVTAESSYETFRTRTIMLPSERLASGVATSPSGGGTGAGDPVVDRYFELQGQRGQLQQDREAIERALAGGLSVDALNSVPAAKESRELGPALDELATKETELRGLRARYSAAYPPVIELEGQVRTLRETTIPTIARALISDLRAREGITQRQVASAGGDLRGIPARSLQEGRLRRTVALAEDLHNTLQQRHEEAVLAEASSIADARVLDRAAVPRSPIRDTGLRNIALAFFASLALGLAAAVMLDRMDPKFRYPSQIARDLGLPILGAIPHVPTAPRRLQDRQDREVAPLIEALRGVRMAILTATDQASPLVFTISSPGSGDGKSFLASHIAFAFAEAGYATVLVDGDIRRGRLHQRFGLDRRPGLCDVLSGGVTLDAAVHPTDYPQLHVLPCGARAHHAPELLGGPGMPVVMAELRRRYQVVIFDSPPLAAGIDAYVLGAATGRLMLVMRTGISHRELMSAKLDVIARMPIDLMGVVMNDVPSDATYGYYAYYLPGYEAKDESPAEEQVTVVT